MADEDSSDKTEEPTQKRLDEALERGDVVKSQEVNTWFILAGAALIVMAFSGPMSSELKITLGGILANAHRIEVDGRGLVHLTEHLGWAIISATGLSFFVLVLAAIRGNVGQHRLVWSVEGLMPKFSKISPAAGLKRMFSAQALMNFVKGLIKLAL